MFIFFLPAVGQSRVGPGICHHGDNNHGLKGQREAETLQYGGLCCSWGCGDGRCWELGWDLAQGGNKQNNGNTLKRI